jgi:ABC-type molybdate transport system permease subunit
LILFAVPMVCWFLLVITMGALATIGVNVKEFDTVSIFFVYLQIITATMVLRWLKRRMIYHDKTTVKQ